MPPLPPMPWMHFLSLFAVALVVTLITTPIAKRIAIKLGAIDYPDARRINKVPIPRMGGIAMFLGLIVALIVQYCGTLAFDWPSAFISHPSLTVNYWGLGVSVLVVFVTGLIDDARSLKPLQKLAGQLVAAVIAAASGLVIGNIVNPFGPGEISLGWLAYPITVVYLVAFANIINLIDGLDGLAIGPMVVAGLVFSVYIYITGHVRFAQYLQLEYISGVGEVAVFCSALAGAGLGFLWFNAYPAQMFMGDVGSLGLGGVLAFLAVLCKQELLLLIVGGLFVAETLSVILQVSYFKASGGKRIFRMAPLHHHYEMKGIPESKIIIRFWIISVMLGLIALSALKLR
ncbi:MAG: phospho-N-acetylmuramoyl-pentapeptide-transferase [Coriobacteriia bacterium]|nr:phospho-N-acetylmuramoyl-pentapeptide-transferase [Coriobacteriia bacterium]